MKRIFLIVLILLYCCAAAFSQSQGKTMYVAIKNAELRTSTGFFSKLAGTLDLGSTVTVLQDNGKWLEVRADNSRTGWITATSLTSRRIINANSTVSAREMALAGKGFSADVEIEYRKSGLDYSAVNSMENLIIPKEELLKFITDGHLSKGE